MLKKLHDTFACCIGDVVIHCVNYCTGILEVRPKFAGGEFKRVQKPEKGRTNWTVPCHVCSLSEFIVWYILGHISKEVSKKND